MTRGVAIDVTTVALMYQCAEMAKTALGFSKEVAKVDHASVKRLYSNRVHRISVTDEGGGHRCHGASREIVDTSTSIAELDEISTRNALD